MNASAGSIVARVLGAMVGLPIAALPVAAGQMTLVWSDEFEGPGVDWSKWDPEFGTGSQYGLWGWGNGEWQYYTSRDDNVDTADGELVITARREAFGGKDYTSARIRTAGKFAFRYGRVEARIRLPKGQGIWPAFWMLPESSPYGGWPFGGEIDVMESVNQMTTLHGTIHFGGPGNDVEGFSRFIGDLSDGYRVFAAEWEPDSIRFFVDGVQYGEVTSRRWYSTGVSNTRAPFDVPFHMILNVAVGGNWPGPPNAGTSFPQSMRVDWVRVYRRLQEPFGGAPATIPGVVEAEDFDLGYPDEAYHEFDYGNNGGAYRETDVDIEPTSGGGFNLGWMNSGDWTEYTVRVERAGLYDLAARVASNQPGGGSFTISRDGEVLSSLSAPFTGGWQSWNNVFGGLQLLAGPQTLRVTCTHPASGGFNLDSLTFAPHPAPCSGVDLASPAGVVNVDDLAAIVANASENDFNLDGDADAVDVIDALRSLEGCAP